MSNPTLLTKNLTFIKSKSMSPTAHDLKRPSPKMILNLAGDLLKVASSSAGLQITN